MALRIWRTKARTALMRLFAIREVKRNRVGAGMGHREMTGG